jgi:hypothetical protein
MRLALRSPHLLIRDQTGESYNFAPSQFQRGMMNEAAAPRLFLEKSVGYPFEIPADASVGYTAPVRWKFMDSSLTELLLHPQRAGAATSSHDWPRIHVMTPS